MATILVVDDNAKVREFLVESLTHSGHQVVTTGHGREAVELVRTHSAQLVITEIIMPEKDGIEVIHELRQVFPNLKVIAISGGGRSDPANYLRSALLLGADRVLAKPFGNSELCAMVDQLLAEAEMQRSVRKSREA
ncbi:MAG: response regulator [Candidatus Krumholzibacteria bacterium]|nr:response regulator [Candidatus Krumholzibacteria bacterium]